MKPFSLLVKPASADCNLRCDYCFYLDRCRLYPETRVHRMPDAVLDRMVGTFLATAQSQHSFGWQGGEPTLMGVEFFKRVTSLEERHGRPGAVVANGLQTNGTLITDALARHLADYKFLVGVSLDGPERIHDRYRRTADGRGSFADVQRGIGLLRLRGAEFNILTLVSQANVREAGVVYRYLRDNGFLFHQYIECVEFDEAGRLLPFAVSGEEWGRFLCGIYDEWIGADTRRVSIRLFDSILAKLVDGIANMCQMAEDCCQYLVVEWNGDVYPCDFFVYADLKLGNIVDMTWEQLLASPVYRAFGQRKRERNAACAACDYVSICAGDCQRHRSRQGLQPRQLSELCKGWKAFYAHALPGLRRLADEIRGERAASAAAQHRPAAPAQRPERNAPCPCGSGRKFKACCGA